MTVETSTGSTSSDVALLNINQSVTALTAGNLMDILCNLFYSHLLYLNSYNVIF